MDPAHNDQSTTNLYLANIREVGPQSRDSEGVVWLRVERAYFGFQPGLPLGKRFVGMTFCPKEVVEG